MVSWRQYTSAPDFRQYLCELDKVKPVVLCGDLNVAHQEIDLKHPGPNRGNAGFSDEERGGGAGVALLIGVVPVHVVAGELQLHLALLDLGLLEAVHVRPQSC